MTKDFIISLTKKAGRFLLDNFKQEKKLTEIRASSKEIITKYDRKVDKLIIEEIKTNFPQHQILTEESGLLKNNPKWMRQTPGESAGTSRPPQTAVKQTPALWIVDSLDGTTNFANHNPLFSVCVAFLKDKELQLGVVYAPALDEFYLAEKGDGAYLNQQQISVSDVKDLNDSYIVYCEGGEKSRERTGNIVTKVYPKVTDHRKIGSAGIETAWVAAGKVDGYWTTKIEPWDVAPGVLLVQEAGGKVSTFNNQTWQVQSSDLVFSNGNLHPD